MKKSMRLKSLMIAAGMTVGLFANYPSFTVNATEVEGGVLSLGRNTISQNSEETVYTYSIPADEKVYINLIANDDNVNPAVSIDAEFEYSDFSIDGASQKICIENYDDEEEELKFTVKSGKDSGFDINIQNWPFSDLPETMQGADEIVDAYLKGVVNGTGYGQDGKTKFNHNKTVSRVQFAIMLYNMAENVYGIDVNDGVASGITFNDINEGNAGYKEVLWASSNGIINGFKNKDGSYSFKPNNPITRQQMALLLMGLAKQMNGDTAISDVRISRAVDYEKIGSSFSDAMSWSCGTGILTGLTKNGKYYVKPSDSALRSQTAMFISRFLSYYDPAYKPGELELDCEYFVINSQNTCKLSVEIPEENHLNPMINYGDNEREKIRLNDDELYGDEKYGDGVYQCDYEFFSNEKGSDEIYLSVNGWNTNKVKVFYFSDEVTDEDLLLEAEVLNGISEINNKYIDENGYVELDNVIAAMDEIEEYANALLEEGKVVVVRRNVLNLYVKTASGLPITYSPNIRNFASGGSDNSIQIITMEPWHTDTVNDPKRDSYELTYDQDAMKLSEKVAKVSFDEDYNYDDQEVTLDVLSSLGKNQIVIIDTHGGYDGKLGPYLSTGHICTDQERKQRDEDLKRDVLLTASLYDKDIFCITNKFIYKYYKKGSGSLDGSFIYLAACFSGEDERLAEALIDCGAETVIGNSGEIYSPYNVEMVSSVMEYLGEIDDETGMRYTIDQAIVKAKEKNGENDLEYKEKDFGWWLTDRYAELKGQLLIGVYPYIFGNENYNLGNDYEGGYYHIFTSGASTWEEAEAYCESLGGHLATITSQKENDYVYSLLAKEGLKSAYFGYTDKDEEGVWKWVDGTESMFTNWAEGEPDSDKVDEDYGMFYFKYPNRKWNDGCFGADTIDGGYAFICEWDTKEAYEKFLDELN